MKFFYKFGFFLKIGIISLNVFFAAPFRKYSGEEYSKKEGNFKVEEKILKNISYRFFLKKISELKGENLEIQELNFLKKFKEDISGYLIYLNRKENNIFSEENNGEDFFVGYFSDKNNEVTLNTLYLKILEVSDGEKNKILSFIFENKNKENFQDGIFLN